MTTIDTSTFTMPCGKGSHCCHPICQECGHPLRGMNTLITDHPGTKQARGNGYCRPCFEYNREPLLTAADLQDQRHILLSDKEMAHILEVNSFMYDWHLRRRYRLQIGEAA